MTTTATDSVKPERIYEPLQFELEDAPENIKAYTLLCTLGTGELITNDELMSALTMGFNLLPRLAPTPGDRVRITELLCDEVRHCYMNDHLARALGGDPSKLTFFSPTGVTFASGVTAAASPALAALLGDRLEARTDEIAQVIPGTSNLNIPGGEGLAALPQLITGGAFGGPGTSFSEGYMWTVFAVFNTCIDRAAGMMVKDTINASFAPLARMNRSIAVDEAGHAQAGFHHLRDVCATKEGHQEAQSALDLIWPLSLTMFDIFPPEMIAECLRFGLMEHTHAELKEKFVEVTVPLFDGLDLCVPAAA